jgi:hypothetical protein
MPFNWIIPQLHITGTVLLYKIQRDGSKPLKKYLLFQIIYFSGVLKCITKQKKTVINHLNGSTVFGLFAKFWSTDFFSGFGRFFCIISSKRGGFARPRIASNRYILDIRNLDLVEVVYFVLNFYECGVEFEKPNIQSNRK